MILGNDAGNHERETIFSERRYRESGFLTYSPPPWAQISHKGKLRSGGYSSY